MFKSQAIKLTRQGTALHYSPFKVKALIQPPRNFHHTACTIIQQSHPWCENITNTKHTKNTEQMCVVNPVESLLLSNDRILMFALSLLRRGSPCRSSAVQHWSQSSALNRKGIKLHSMLSQLAWIWCHPSVWETQTGIEFLTSFFFRLKKKAVGASMSFREIKQDLTSAPFTLL